MPMGDIEVSVFQPQTKNIWSIYTNFKYTVLCWANLTATKILCESLVPEKVFRFSRALNWKCLKTSWMDHLGPNAEPEHETVHTLGKWGKSTSHVHREVDPYRSCVDEWLCIWLHRSSLSLYWVIREASNLFCSFKLQRILNKFP